MNLTKCENSGHSDQERGYGWLSSPVRNQAPVFGQKLEIMVLRNE